MAAPAQPGSLPKPLLLFIAFVQGLLLLAIYRALDAHYWPWQQPVYLYPLVSFALVAPTLCLLSFTHGHIQSHAKWIGLFTACLLSVAAYTGAQLEPADKIEDGAITFVFIVTTLVACFKALMYIQQRGNNQPLSYSALFRYSWQNFLVLGLSILFALIFWGILYLCGALFKVINIGFVEKLIKHDWFYIPVIALAHGFGVLIFRNLVSVIDTIAKILQMLMKFLLPVLMLVAVAFLTALPFTGLQTLWGTGHGSMLILGLQVLVLFFINAVYQDESSILPYPLLVHRAIYCGTALLPVYSVIASLGLYARITQYGFSVERCWALLLWLLLSLFAVGYVWGIIQRRDQWIEKLSTVNIRMGLIVLALMLLVNSPLLDFRKISLASQMHKFDTGLTTPATLDVTYIDRYLGRSGYLVLQSLKEKYAATNPEFVKRIDVAMTHYNRNKNQDKKKPSLEEFGESLVKAPDTLVLPDKLLEAIYNDKTKNEWRWKNLHALYLIECDLNQDGTADYVFVDASENSGQAELWHFVSDQWQVESVGSNNQWSKVNLAALLKENNIELIKPQWQRLKIGDMLFTVYEHE